MGIDISLSGAGLFIMYEFIHIVKEKMFLRGASWFVVAALRSGAWPRRRSGRLGGTP
jgi:hypothetical protein